MSPFVTVPKPVRWGFVGLIVAWQATMSMVGLVNAGNEVMAYLLFAVLSWIAISLQLYPFIFYRPEYGFLHPLIFLPAYALLQMMLRNFWAPSAPLREHIALPTWNEESLILLNCYQIFLGSLGWACVLLIFRLKPKFRVPTRCFSEKASTFALPVLLAVVGFGVLVFLLLAARFGGLGGILLAIAKGGSEKAAMMSEGGEGMGQYMVPINAVFVSALIWLSWKRNALRSPLFLTVGLLACVLQYSATGKRSFIVFGLLLLSLAYIMTRRRVPYIWLGVGAAASVFLIGILGLYRWHNQVRTEADLNIFSESSASSILEAFSSENLRRTRTEAIVYPILATVPSEVMPLFGTSYLEMAYRFVPRYFWPTKPRGIDTQANRVFYGGHWPMPPGALGEAYWNGLIPGVVIVYLCYGLLLLYMVRLVERNGPGVAVVSIYIVTLWWFQPTTSMMTIWLQTFVPMLGILWLCGFIVIGRPPKTRMRLATQPRG